MLRTIMSERAERAKSSLKQNVIAWLAAHLLLSVGLLYGIYGGDPRLVKAIAWAMVLITPWAVLQCYADIRMRYEDSESDSLWNAWPLVVTAAFGGCLYLLTFLFH